MPQPLDEVFLGSAAIEAGLVTRSELAGPRYQRLHRGVYAPSALRVDHGTWCRSALLVVPDAVVAGRSAAWLSGARSAARTGDPVTVVVRPEAYAPQRAGIRSRAARVDEADLVLDRGIPRTTACRAAWDIAAHESLDQAVPVIDELLFRRAVTVGELWAYAARRGRWPGSALARRALALCDENAESPPESRVRLALDLAGIRPRTQVDVRDAAGQWVARVDMAYEEERLAVEYDGGWHAEAGQLARDRDRLNRLQAAGWTVIFVTAADLWRLDEVVDRVRAALLRLRS